MQVSDPTSRWCCSYIRTGLEQSPLRTQTPSADLCSNKRRTNVFKVLKEFQRSLHEDGWDEDLWNNNQWFKILSALKTITGSFRRSHAGLPCLTSLWHLLEEVGERPGRPEPVDLWGIPLTRHLASKRTPLESNCRLLGSHSSWNGVWGVLGSEGETSQIFV